MTTKEAYNAARADSIGRVFMEFDNTTKKHPKSLFAFYEGKDNAYYYSRIENISRIPFETFRCGGKSEVKKVYNLLDKKAEYKKYKTAFFIDKDYDENNELFLADFFVTDRYSVENYYTSLNALERILKNFFGLRDTDAIYQKTLSEYEDYLEAYNNAILRFNAWYGFLKRNKILNTSLSLEEKFPSDYIRCNPEKKTVAMLYNLEKLQEDYPLQPVVAEVDVRKVEEELKQDLSCNLRGKYQLTFMVKFLNDFNAELKQKEKGLSPNSIHYQTYEIPRVMAMQLFSEYADTPKSLIDYIERRVA